MIHCFGFQVLSNKVSLVFLYKGILCQIHSLQCVMMKCCLLFLFLLLSGQNSAADNTLKTTFDNGFADWNVQNKSWVTKNWQEIKKGYNGSLPEPSTTNSVRPFNH